MMQDSHGLQAAVTAWVAKWKAVLITGDRFTDYLSEAVQVHQLIRERADEVARQVTAAGGGQYDLEAARDVDAALHRWAVATGNIAAVLPYGTVPAGLDDRAAAAVIAFQQAVRYTSHARSVTPEQAEAELSRIEREGFRQGVTTEAVRRELLPGRMGSGSSATVESV